MINKINLKRYQSLIFDCDGVVLNSNAVKSDAFYRAVLPYGKKYAKDFVEYHKTHGGISRYKKLQYFLSNIVSGEIEGYGYEALLKSYAIEVKSGMLKCQHAEKLDMLRNKTSDSNWLIASGGDQEELREIFVRRGLDTLFDGGIFGSPDSKEIIFERELALGNIQTPALFLGDSTYDYKASSQFEGVDFLFVSDWTEVQNWQEWTELESLCSIRRLSSLV